MATARIYVGTYGKYNSGNLAGQWLDLEDYADKGDFYEACAELHGDEEDPEFLFNDWEGIPEGLVGESWVSDEVWEWLQYDEEQQEIITAARRVFGDIEPQQALDACRGQYDSEQAYAEEFVDACGYLDGVPETVARYFDYEAFARDLFIDDVTRDDDTGYVFSRNW